MKRYNSALFKEIWKSFLWKGLGVISTILFILNLNKNNPDAIVFNKIIGVLAILRVLDFGIIYLRRTLEKKDILDRQILVYRIIYLLACICGLTLLLKYWIIDSILMAVSGLIYQESFLKFNRVQKNYLITIPIQISIIVSLILVSYDIFHITLSLLIFTITQLFFHIRFGTEWQVNRVNIRAHYTVNILSYFLINLAYISYSEFASLGLEHFPVQEYTNSNIFNRLNLIVFSVFIILPNSVWNNSYERKHEIDKTFLNLWGRFKILISISIIIFIVYKLISIVLLKSDNTNLIILSAIYCSIGCVNIYLINLFYRKKETPIILIITLLELIATIIVGKLLSNAFEFFVMLVGISSIKFIILTTNTKRLK